MSTEHPEPPDFLLVGRYRLSRLIGEGGMGRVWEGNDELLDRPVAIKELTINEHLPAAEIEVLRTRMLREARSAAQLSHPSIITVFDVVEKDGFPWIVMELVRGSSLSEIIKEQGPITPERAANIGLQVVAALAVAHQRGIVHRDIKPGNVLVAKDDRAVLTDFGIARLEGTSSLTRTGNLLGSPSYLAPEQARGEVAGPHTDMWSLGTTLYAALHGSPPFQRSTPMATLTAVVVDDVPTPLRAGPLRPLLEDLLDKNPANRPTVHEAAAILQEIVLDAPREALAAPEPVPPVEPTIPVPTSSEPADVTTSLPVPPPPAEPVEGGSGEGVGRTAALLGLAVLIIGAVIAAVVFLAPSGGADPDRADPPASDGPPASPTPETSAPTSPADEDAGDDDEESDDAPLPLTRYEDESGFSLDVPEGWDVEREGRMVYFRDPDGGYLLVDQTDTPGEDAGEDWERQSQGAAGRFPDYDEIGIDDVDEPYLEDYVSAADWEFTFTRQGREMHAVNRGFHNEDKGYALFLVYPEDEWDVGEDLLEAMTESFEPAS